MINSIRTIHFDSINKINKKIIFIHGFASTSKYIHDYYKKYLQDNFSLDTIELPGLGLNQDKLNKYNINSYADYCIKLINENKWSNFILVGHSMGGAIVEIICTKIPELIDKAILISPMNSSFSFKLFNFFRWKRKQDIKSLKFNLNFLYYNQNKIFNNKEEIQEYFFQMNKYYTKNKTIIKKLFKSFISFRTRKWLKNSETQNEIRTLVLLATNDQIIDFRTSYKKLQKNKNYEIEIIQNSGHMPFIEESKLTTKFIKNFINK